MCFRIELFLSSLRIGLHSHFPMKSKKERRERKIERERERDRDREKGERGKKIEPREEEKYTT